jgi:aspartyl-tRNA(Asn)/glutamyl-tRNA(Gln) amidotransferase subunit A
MTNLTSLTIAEARQKLKAKEFSALELTDAYIAAVEKARSLNAYIVETPDQARSMAKSSDAKLAKGEGRALEGIPLGIKDLFATKDAGLLACSRWLQANL